MSPIKHRKDQEAKQRLLLIAIIAGIYAAILITRLLMRL